MVEHEEYIINTGKELFFLLLLGLEAAKNKS